MAKMTLNESQFVDLVTEAVIESMAKQGYPINEAMDEGFGDFVRGAWNKVRGDAGSAASKFGRGAAQMGRNATNSVKNAATRMGNGIRDFGNRVDAAADRAIDKYGMKAQNGVEAVGNAVRGAGQKVGQYAQGVKQAGIDASNIGDIQNAIKTIQSLAAKGFVKGYAANMIIGNLNKAMQQIQGGAQ